MESIQTNEQPKTQKSKANDVTQSPSPFTFEQAIHEIDVMQIKVLIPFG